MITIEKLCNRCGKHDTCEVRCAAMTEIYKIYNLAKTEKQLEYIKNIRELLGIRDAEPSKALEELADKIINKFPELAFIREFGIRVGYVASFEVKKSDKVTYADCRKVTEVYKAWLPFDYIITFYEYNVEGLSDNQKKILMLHGLKHITITDKGTLGVRPHDVEDFKEVLNKYGTNWSGKGVEVLDILGGEEI